MLRFPKDPIAVKMFTLDLSNWLLPGETVMDHSVVSSAGLVIDDSQIVNDGTGVLAMISGGVSSELYDVKYTWTTNLDRVDKRTIYFTVKER
jgi:hypothetical protein